MPDFVAVSGSVEVRIKGIHTVSGKAMYNIIHVDAGVPLPDNSDCHTIALAVQSWCAAYYRDIINEDITIDEIRARSNAEEPGPVDVLSALGIVGSLGGDIVPLDQSLCVNLTTGRTGAARRGRFFVFPADELNQTDGLYISSYADACATALAQLDVGLLAAGEQFVIESRSTLSLYPVTGQSSQRIPSRLRSRKVNHGI